MYRYIKALAALIGGLSPVAVVGALTILGVYLDVSQVAALLAVISPAMSTLATTLAPANAPPDL